AWEQLEEVLEANRKMKLMQFTATLLTKTYDKYVSFRKADGLLGFTAKLNGKILHNNLTIKSNIHQSRIPNQVLQYSFTKLIRKNTSMQKQLKISNLATAYAKVTTGLNKTNGFRVMPKDAFGAINEIKNINTITSPSSVAQVKVWSTQSNLDKDYVFNVKGFQGGLPDVNKWDVTFTPTVVLANRPDVIGNITVVDNPVIVNQPDLNINVNRIPNNVLNVGNRRNRISTRPPITVHMSNRPTGTIVNRPTGTIVNRPSGPIVNRPSGPVVNRPTQPSGPVTQPTRPSGPVVNPTRPSIPVRDDILISTAIANNRLSLAKQNAAMKTSFNNLNFRMQFSDTVREGPGLSFNNLSKAVNDRIKPFAAFKSYKDYLIKWPSGIKIIPKEEFLPAMAYPDFPEPVYKYLTDIDDEFLLPNLELIPPNTLSLLKTN
ncbi:MAG: hypothetical protein AAGK97_14905, partial [Bacteroidota bacterium]